MVDKNVVKSRADRVVEYLRILDDIRRNHSREEFLANPLIYGSAERFLQLCLEALLDIGNHLIADDRLGKVEHYHDIPRVLIDKKILGPDIGKSFGRMIGFRNILVHDYLEIDLEVVYGIILHDLGDIEQILQQYLEYIQ